MRDLKYLIISVMGDTELVAILFNGFISHSAISCEEGEIVSAGFCSIFLNKDTCKIKVKTYGGSSSLDLESKEGDAGVIIKTLSRTHTFI